MYDASSGVQLLPCISGTSMNIQDGPIWYHATTMQHVDVQPSNARINAMQGGEMLPGQKGLSMTAEQWAVAVANVDKINKDLGLCS
jgi:hypothetical protein